MATDTTKDRLIRGRVLRGTISNYLGNFVAIGTGFFLTPFILDRLGASSYGLWALVGSTVAYGTLLELGIAGAVTKYVAEHRARGAIAEARSLVSTALALYSFLALLAITLSLAIAPVFPGLFNIPEPERATVMWLVLLMGASVGISIPCVTSGAVLRGLQRFDLVNLITVAGTLLSAAATVTVLLLGGGLLGMVAVNIPISLAMQAVSIWLIYRVAPELQFGWRGAKGSLLRPIFAFSLSLFTMNIAGRLQTKTDEIVIGAFLPISAVTSYSIARRLSEFPKLMTDQFLKVLMPLASELHAENDHARLQTLYIVGTRMTLAISLPLGCTLMVLAQSALALWVGPAYAGYAHLVVILTLASLIDASQWPAGSVLQGMARHRPLAIMSIGSGVANLVLSLVLVTRFGISGVALGTLIPTAVECFGFVLPYALKVVGVSPKTVFHMILLPTILPAIPMGIVLYILQRTVDPVSFAATALVALAGIITFVIGYISVGASAAERRTYYGLVLQAMRIASARFKRA